jgi:hypothetical protein
VHHHQQQQEQASPALKPVPTKSFYEVVVGKLKALLSPPFFPPSHFFLLLAEPLPTKSFNDVVAGMLRVLVFS